MVLLKRRYIMQYQPLYFLSNGTGTYIIFKLDYVDFICVRLVDYVAEVFDNMEVR